MQDPCHQDQAEYARATSRTVKLATDQLVGALNEQVCRPWPCHMPPPGQNPSHMGPLLYRALVTWPFPSCIILDDYYPRLLSSKIIILDYYPRLLSSMIMVMIRPKSIIVHLHVVNNMCDAL